MAGNEEPKELTGISERKPRSCRCCCCCCGSVQKRFILVFMVFLGFTTMYALRVNLNVAIGAMVNNHTVQVDGREVTKTAEFNWDSKLQGVVLGSLYYGYLVFQVPGAWLAFKVGATRLFGCGVFLASLLTLLTPIAARLSVYALILLRASEGLFLGVLIPCNIVIWSKWSHSMERTALLSFAASGCSAGTIITMPLTGLLTKYGFDGGWPSVFYCFGGFGILWFLAWAVIVEENPSQHSTITKEEKEYLEEGRGKLESIPIPWVSILTSKPVWAIIMANIALDWHIYTILICLPTFLLDVLHFDIQAAGFITALPFITRFFTMPLSGTISDVFRRNGVRTKIVRQVSLAVGIVSASFFLVLAGYCTTSSAVITAMCISVGFSGAARPAYDVNALDIAPYFAGIIIGISNTIGTLSGFLSPMLVGFLTQNKKRSEWQVVFWIAAAIDLIGAVTFCVFVDDQYQPWAQMGHVLDKDDVTLKLPEIAHEDTDKEKQGENTCSPPNGDGNIKNP